LVFNPGPSDRHGLRASVGDVQYAIIFQLLDADPCDFCEKHAAPLVRHEPWHGEAVCCHDYEASPKQQVRTKEAHAQHKTNPKPPIYGRLLSIERKTGVTAEEVDTNGALIDSMHEVSRQSNCGQEDE
jgi:hypothetical protein